MELGPGVQEGDAMVESVERDEASGWKMVWLSSAVNCQGTFPIRDVHPNRA